MKKRKIYLSITLIIIVITAFFVMKDNIMVKAKNPEMAVFDNKDSRFEILLDSFSSNPTLKSNTIQEIIKKVKYVTIKDFLNNSKSEIAFREFNSDTLIIKYEDNILKYESTLNLGELDQEFNNLLIENLKASFKKNKIEELYKLEIYTLTPSLIGDMPLVPGTFNNLKDYEFGSGLDGYFDINENWKETTNNN